MTRPDQRPSREELLTKQFYEWELRGRGWQVWQEPVELEPPFRPFFGHFASAIGVADDARKPTIMSSFLDRLRGRQAIPSIDEIKVETDEEPEPKADTYDAPHIEFRISAPQTLKVSKEISELFLFSLDVCRGPLSFEILASGGGIDVLLVSREFDALHVRSQLTAYFPDAIVREGPATPNQIQRLDDGKESIAVGLGFSNEFMLPLATPRNLDHDPLIAIVGAFANVRQDEQGLLQVLFAPLTRPWTTSVLRAVSDSKGDSFFTDAPEMLSLARQKIAKPLFAVNIRLVAQSGSDDRTRQILLGLYGALSQFSNPVGNELITLSDDGYSQDELIGDVLLRRTHRSGMIWNSDELASLVHVPSASLRSTQLNRATDRSKLAPSISNGGGLVLGTNEHAGISTAVSLTPSQRARHTYVLGASGTGKSTFLLNCILQDMRNGEGIAVLDPHGDLIERVLEYIPGERIEDVILLDPADESYPVGFNILSAHSDLEKTLLSSDLVAVFRRLSTSWGDQMTSVLGNALLAFLESKQGGTLLDLRRFLVEPDFRSEFLKTVTDRDIVYFWQKEFPQLVGRPQAPLLTRLDTFLRPKLIRRMVGQQENRLDFRKIMDSRKIFLAKLAQGAIGEENSYLLGTLLVAKLHQTALGRQDTRTSERIPFYLYVDEFQNFITPSMASILSGARKYGLGLVLAHQDLRQLWSEDTQVASAVISNPCTRVCFRLGDFDAQKLDDGFSFFTAADLQNLGTGEAICRIERADYDFNLKALPVPEISTTADAIREKCIAYSRSKYAADSREVEGAVETIVVPADPSNAPVLEPTAQVQNVLLEKRRASKNRSSEPTIPAVFPGRGGAQHKYLQQLIKRMAEAQGYRATVEKEELGGIGKIDVSIEREEKKIACEISVTSTGEQELANVQKCIAAGYRSIVVLSVDRKLSGRLAAYISERVEADIWESLSFLLPDEFPQYLEKLKANEVLPESGTVVRGYRVKVSYTPSGARENLAKQQSVSNVIVQAMRRLKG
jgi:Type IV secretion-system coupling protein DNA-binding domain